MAAGENTSVFSLLALAAFVGAPGELLWRKL